MECENNKQRNASTPSEILNGILIMKKMENLELQRKNKSLIES